jgi:transcriptional regulator with XRE-family HTH domain
VDTRTEIREFLTSRRAKITPDQAGLHTYGSGPRRVPGLRREEVALLAGVSVDYYTRLERGNAAGVSETVLDALARALQLDEPERAHLFNVRFHDTGDKRFHHPVVGELSLTFETMRIEADPQLTMFVYTAEIGSKSEEALSLLASWTATLEPSKLDPFTPSGDQR